MLLMLIQTNTNKLINKYKTNKLSILIVTNNQVSKLLMPIN